MSLKNRSLFFLIPIVLILYLVSRIQNLVSIPIFGDEAIYLRWSQVIRSVETLRFLPLTDGKQPLFMWLTISLLKIFSNPLFAGRLLSLIAGLVILMFLSLFSVLLISSDNSKQPVDHIIKSVVSRLPLFLLTGLIYVILPFTFFFDRLAVPDNLLAMFASISLVLVLLLYRYPRLDLSLLLGFSLGAAWLTKSPALIFVSLVLFFAPFYYQKNLKFYLYPLLSSLMAFAIYNLLRLGPQFHMIASRNLDYVWPLQEILRHPLDPLKPHLSDVYTLYRYYLGLPLLVIFLLALATRRLFSKLALREYLLLLIWWLPPLFFNLIFAKVLTARYLLYTILPLIPLFSISLYTLLSFSQPWLRYLSLTLFILNLFAGLYFEWHLSAKPFETILPSTETGYLSDWTSGWGIYESSLYLRQRASKYNVIVGTEGYFGTLPDGLQAYVNNVPQLTVFGVGLGFSEIPSKLIDARQHGDDVYLLINQSRLKLTDSELSKLTLVKFYPKPGNDKLLLFALK